MHDDNASRVYIAKEILFCQWAKKENIYSGVSELDWDVCEICLFSKAAHTASGACFLYPAKVSLFYTLKILAEANHKEQCRQ